jgi:hypothetical protein
LISNHEGQKQPLEIGKSDLEKRIHRIASSSMIEDFMQRRTTWGIQGGYKMAAYLAGGHPEMT